MTLAIISFLRKSGKLALHCRVLYARTIITQQEEKFLYIRTYVGNCRGMLISTNEQCVFAFFFLSTYE